MAGLVVLGIVLFVGSAHQARASEDMAIDATIEALAASGIVPVPTEDLRSLSPLLKCMVHGDKEVLDCAKDAVYQRVLGKDLAQAGPILECIIDGKPVALCAKEAAVAKLPPELRAILDCGSDVGQCVTKLAATQLPPGAQKIADCLASKQKVADCASQEVISRLPPEAQSAARCLAQGKDPKVCAQEEIISRLPAGAKPVAECIAQGRDPAKCAEDQLISKLPPQAQAVFNCIENRGDPADCAAKNATGETKKQIEAIKKLSDPAKLPTILGLFQAIQDEDWPTVVALGGVQGAKVASCVVIKVVTAVPGPQQQALCDYAGALIETRAVSVQTFLQQAKASDTGGMISTLTKAALIDEKCTLLGEISKDLQEVTCGNLAKAIDAAADGSPAVVGILATVLSASPWVGIVAGVVLIIGLVDGKDDDCKKPEQYFVDTYMPCQHQDVYLHITNPQKLAELSDQRTRACISYFTQCLDEDDAAKMCRGLTAEFARQTQVLARAYGVLAKGRAQSQRHYLEADRSQICAPTQASERFTEAKSGFISSCTSMLNDIRPLKNLAQSCSASDPNQRPGFLAAATAQSAACETAAQEFLPKIINDVCVGAGVCFPVKKCDPEKEICGVDVK